MPHVIPIPGLFVKDPQPMNDEFRAFVENAEHGVIVSMDATVSVILLI